MGRATPGQIIGNEKRFRLMDRMGVPETDFKDTSTFTYELGLVFQDPLTRLVFVSFGQHQWYYLARFCPLEGGLPRTASHLNIPSI
jgi:hypothetical protein